MASDGNGAGAIIYFGQVGASPTNSVVTTDQGNFADWYFFELTRAKVILDTFVISPVSQVNPRTLTMTPTKPGIAVALLSARSSTLPGVTPLWTPLLIATDPTLGCAAVVIRVIQRVMVGLPLSVTFTGMDTDNAACMANLGGY